jgi:ribosomal-protein-alanine N-acetyltransferase
VKALFSAPEALLTDEGIELLEAVSRLDSEKFPWPWTRKDWLSLSSTQRYHLFVLKDGAGLLGFALFDFLDGDSTSHLLKIIIKKELQGSGGASLLLSKAKSYFKEERAESFYLEVSSSNDRAINFYKKNGFSILRTIKHFYGQGSDAFAMQCVL